MVKLITESPAKWVEQLDFKRYAVRQAQSCDYLELLFYNILSNYENEEPNLIELLNYLKEVHRRQYSDIAAIVPVPDAPNRGSFYFTSMYNESDDSLLTTLLIHGISYLRGKQRYKLLKQCDVEENLPFIDIWNQFYLDAESNAIKVFSFAKEKFPDQFELTLTKFLELEDEMMHRIWRFKRRKGV